MVIWVTLHFHSATILVHKLHYWKIPNLIFMGQIQSRTSDLNLGPDLSHDKCFRLNILKICRDLILNKYPTPIVSQDGELPATTLKWNRYPQMEYQFWECSILKKPSKRSDWRLTQYKGLFISTINTLWKWLRSLKVLKILITVLSIEL